jgi:ribonuclease VapC
MSIFEKEDDAPVFQAAIASADELVMSAVNVHETAIILRARRGEENAENFWKFLKISNISVIPFDEDQARIAGKAFALYGKGMNTRAKLNLADCVAYALAKSLDAPLLFKGNDFIHTDVAQAIARTGEAL